ncbi:hypothetical protein S7711_03117 [Stachybotrys chartarum IBT 7711]|uniref:Uncharacterized protein n=1 Tax=Stachybotrys chartarum (strain CBS 109288 / IBT 7711) TaxID=1280523 RepID=A0A084B8D9_STACB|nr:hypothetical protein S7711_03117 [Stachybotrys chartarum IBT 7711]
MAASDFVSSQFKSLPILLKPTDCQGRTFIITGANGGLGFEATRHLVALGAARVVMAVRNLESGRSSKSDIEITTGRRDVLQVWHLDLASYESVKKFVREVEEKLDRVDVLVANAGVNTGRWELTEGTESQLTVNCISNLLLTVLMVPIMRNQKRELGIEPKIVHVGSRGAFLAAKPPHIGIDVDNIFNDLNSKQRWQTQVDDRYILTKLLQLFALRQLATLASPSQTSVVLNITDPGLCRTGLTQNTRWQMRLSAYIGKLMLGRSAEMGSRTILAAVAAGEESHGKFLIDCEVAEDSLPGWVTSEDGKIFQQRFWGELAVRLEAIQPGCIDAVVNKTEIS